MIGIERLRRASLAGVIALAAAGCSDGGPPADATPATAEPLSTAAVPEPGSPDAAGDPNAVDSSARQPADATNQAGDAVSAPQRPAAGRALSGTVSGLSGTVSGLQGLVEQLGGEIRDDTVFVALPADTLFDFDSAEISSVAQAELTTLAELIDRTTGQVALIGHTDNVGSDAHNLTLSRQRAQAVADALHALGVQTQRLSVDGRGAQAPVADNTHADGRDNPNGRAQNRRVEAIIPAG